MGKGLFAYVTYRVDTKIGHGSPGTESEYCVYRRFRDFARLDAKLQETYRRSCIIVPPPPDKSSINSIWTKVSNINSIWTKVSSIHSI